MHPVMPWLQKLTAGMHPAPGITGVENRHVLRIFQGIELRQPEQWFNGIQGSASLCPEICRRKHGHVATKSVDAALVYPPPHTVDHLFP